MKETTRVMIVDDDVNFADTTVDLLIEKGFDCISVNSGHEAIHKVKETTFDIIFLDVRMPVMNGIETYKEIKKIRPNVVIIFVTAYRMDELAEDALREGKYGLVYKPVDINKIVKIIERSKKGGALVMVLDDDPNTCETLKDNLEEQGYIVTTALNGEEAIDLAKEKPHEIVFIDVRLPPLNGLVTYLEMKKINPDVVAVMTTKESAEMDDIAAKALDQGAYTCIYKPFDVDKVIGVVEEIVNKMKGGKYKCQKQLRF